MIKLLTLFLLFSLFLQAHAETSKNTTSNSNSQKEILTAHYKIKKGPERITIRIYPSEKNLTFFWNQSQHNISFLCDNKGDNSWSCVNDCQMGKMTIEFVNGFQKIKIHPYKLTYQSCDPNIKFPTLNVHSKKSKLFKRIK